MKSLLLIAWATASIGGVGYLMSFHLTPAAGPAEKSGFAGGSDDAFQVLHFLDADCGCSRIVARALARRGASGEFAENVYWAGANEALEDALEAAGFDLRRSTREGLEGEFGVAGVPQLAVLRDGEAAYVGGYAARLPVSEADVRDQEVIAEVRAGAARPAWPVFGCSTGASERRARDPLGWRYRR